MVYLQSLASLTWSYYSSKYLNLKWAIPPAEENSPIPPTEEDSPPRAYLLATLDSASISFTIELALKDLDPHLHPHYPLTLTLKDPYLARKVQDLQARLPEIMPHAHRLGLITLKAAPDNKQ